MERHLLGVLRSSNHINQIKQIHALSTTTGISFSPLLVKKLVYLSHFNYAHKVFDEIPQRDEYLYNLFISAYTKIGSYKKAIDFFCLMRTKETHMSSYTLPPVLKSCSAFYMVGLGKQVHSLIINYGLESNNFVQTSLMDLYARSGNIISAKMVFDGILDRDPITYNCLMSAYSKFGDVLAAQKVFDEMPEKTIVSWNTIISCYSHSGNHHEALRMFDMMQEEKCQANGSTIATVLSICATLGDLDLGWRLKKYVDDNNMISDMVVSTALMEMFVKCGEIHEARQVFDCMKQRDIITWGSMIAGYIQNGRAFEALELFKSMRNENIKPDHVTLVSALTACAHLGSEETGEQIRSYIESEGFDSNIYVASALLTMYSRCGNMNKAWQVFNQMKDKDIVCWNAMITGLAMNGHAKDAICLYEKMKETNIRPDRATFGSLLTACTHAGLVDLGLEIFHSMPVQCDIVPDTEHYACIVDLFCRHGRISEAYQFICQMEKPNVVIWGTLLSACRTYSNTELAELALTNLVELEPDNSGNYVLLSNIYANTERWQDSVRVRNMLREKRVSKTKAYSWIELEDGIHKFLVADTLHTSCMEIYEVVVGLAMLSSDDVEMYGELF
ncbi:putative pentatricopeptide repeat-containing protein At3g08820 [Amaranthus tricolor]|uniref:putative pentatricopeptide repeat-containing protein At3g08820 n=1 Tax=Amaranthus tricolor TaxID=29722 RepID=UPI00258BD4AD|nr:putative pentatricopeptide repeat-containing protein At3g08820 [Amaranthus tricolor]XP_057523125.1 putative pentatricopeptide repeat-containing protein At3g08820 [Amaranthus tricolor]XP_057523126.1 putative pentatricopeptide repeat-containing protein At3g08820 [Amaranthus tricolor]